MPEPNAIPRKIIFSVTFWGKWHTDALLEALLPSLLSANNLPRLARDFELEFSFLTTRADRARLESSPLFPHLRACADVSIQENQGLTPERRFAIHHAWWRRAIARAKRERAFLGLLPPDLCFSDGSLAAIGERIGDGAACLYISGLRVASETFLPDVRHGFGFSREFLTHARLVELTLEHSHPFNNLLELDAPRAPYIAEMMLQPVAGTGWVKHCYLAGPIVFVDPARVTISPANIVTAVDDPRDFHVVYDSHEVGMVSLAPLTLYAEWALGGGAEDAFTKAFKLRRQYASVSSDLVARRNFAIYTHQKRQGNGAWRRGEERMNAAVRGVRTSTALLDIGDALERRGLRDASAAAFLLAQVARPCEVDPSAALLCLLDDDGAFADRPELSNDEWRDHVLRHLFQCSASDPASVRNFLGESVSFVKTRNGCVIDGKSARRHGSGDRVTIYTVTSGTTPQVRRRRRLPPTQKSGRALSHSSYREFRLRARAWLVRRLSPRTHRALVHALGLAIDITLRAAALARHRKSISRVQTATGSDGEAWIDVAKRQLERGLVVEAVRTADRACSTCEDPGTLYQLGRLLLGPWAAEDSVHAGQTPGRQGPVKDLLSHAATAGLHTVAHACLAAAAVRNEAFAANAHHLDGLLYEMEGALDRAEDQFEKALERAPTSAHPRRSLARVQEARGNGAAAIEALAAAVEWSPDDFQSLKSLAALLYAQGERHLALDMAYRAAVYGRHRPLYAVL